MLPEKQSSIRASKSLRSVGIRKPLPYVLLR